MRKQCTKCGNFEDQHPPNAQGKRTCEPGGTEEFVPMLSFYHIQLLQRWSHAGEEYALHCIVCMKCLTTPQRAVEVSGCAEGDRLWRVLQAAEAEVIGILPDLQEAGMDVSQQLGGFKFIGLRT